MNAKKAKQLRRLAEKSTVGKPAERLIHHPVRFGNAIQSPMSTRGHYLDLKRAHRTLERRKP